MEINNSKRLLGKDERLEKFKCWNCLFQDCDPLSNAPGFSCSICRDRPTRNKDKSEFVQDFTDEQRERQCKQNLDEQNGKGRYNF